MPRTVIDHRNKEKARGPGGAPCRRHPPWPLGPFSNVLPGHKKAPRPIEPALLRLSAASLRFSSSWRSDIVGTRAWRSRATSLKSIASRDLRAESPASAFASPRRDESRLPHFRELEGGRPLHLTCPPKVDERRKRSRRRGDPYLFTSRHRSQARLLRHANTGRLRQPSLVRQPGRQCDMAST